MQGYKFRKTKRYFNNFKMGMVKNGRGHSGCKIKQLAVSQEWIKYFWSER